jgi:hypothetical protein
MSEFEVRALLGVPLAVRPSGSNAHLLDYAIDIPLVHHSPKLWVLIHNGLVEQVQAERSHLWKDSHTDHCRLSVDADGATSRHIHRLRHRAGGVDREPTSERAATRRSWKLREARRSRRLRSSVIEKMGDARGVIPRTTDDRATR